MAELSGVNLSLVIYCCSDVDIYGYGKIDSLVKLVPALWHFLEQVPCSPWLFNYPETHVRKQIMSGCMNYALLNLGLFLL